jgi:hypothetical protein
MLYNGRKTIYRFQTTLRSSSLHIPRRWLSSILLLLLFPAASAWATEYHGLVTYAGLPVPGATVTLTQGGKKYVTITDTQGFYSFPALADGPATLDVEMTGFGTLKQEIAVAADAPMAKLELKLLTLEEMRSALKPVLSAPYTVAQAASAVVKTSEPPKPTAAQAAAAAANAPPAEDVSQRAADGLLVQGSVNNAATSQFTLAPRFGNTASGKSLYSYSLNVREENSALDAKSYSLAGIDTTKPQTNELTGGFAIQGPLKIPHLLRNGPNIFVGYQRTENSFAETQPGLVPTTAERKGDLSALASTQGQALVAPASGPQSACLQSMGIAPGAPIPGNVIPASCVSPIAQSLWSLYPQPNFTGNAAYNYQVPLVTDTHSDALNSNVNKTIGRKNQISGNLGVLSNRVSDQTLLGFLDTTHSLGINATVNLSHTINAHFHWNVGYQFSRQSNRSTPFFQDRAVYGQNGLLGNDPDPTYGGPPTLSFTSGLAALSDGQSSFGRNQTNGVSYVFRWNRSPHNVTVGVDFRRQQFNYLSQANARGTLSFTGAATGSDVADFLLGVPATTAIGYGNADKYLRQTAYDAYLNDDWRVNPQLTINAGLRYEYGAPITEVKQRLANLDVASGFSAVAPVLASAPKGSLTGQSYPSSLTRPDRTAIEPRIAASWRPIPGSSLLVSAGYGITYDTSVYQGVALDLAQQSPLATSFTYQNGAGCNVTLNNAFGCTPFSNFGVDPNYRVGYLQTWNLKLQRDLPESIQMTAIYLGNKGSRGAQLFLPNTNPVGATNPCPSCPSGFEYLASGGGSTRESGQVQLRRRLKSGFTASVLYTYSKSLDDDSSLGGQGAATAGSATLAQDWRNLRGERGLSTFDQRHLLNVGVQYTTGMGKGGGTLLTGWRGRAYKEWTVQTQITAGSGLPETPLDTAETVAGYNAFVRPNVTGASVYAPPAGRFLNPAAYTAPAPGQWGNARRDSITGPNQFTLNAALVRTFRLNPRFNLDAQIASQNAINHVTYSSYITNINSTQFGLPAAANAMRQTQVALRLRF